MRHGLIPALRDAVERQPEALGFSRLQASGAAAHDGHTFAQHHLAVGIVKHAIELHRLQRAVAGVGDLAHNLHHGLLQIAFRGLYLDLAQLQVAYVLLGFGAQRRALVRLPAGLALQVPEQRSAYRQHRHDRHRRDRNAFSRCFRLSDH